MRPNPMTVQRAFGAFACCLGAGLASAANGGMVTEIDFDSVSVPSATTFVDRDLYWGSGVRFDRDIPIGRVQLLDQTKYSEFLELGGTSPNGLTLKSGLGYSIEASFFHPGTDIAATTDWVSLLFYDTNVGTLLGSLEAFDLAGNLLASVSRNTPVELGSVFEISHPGIHRLRISVDADGGVADNLAFLSIPEVPAPGTLALAALAGAFGRGRRRRTA